MKKLLKLGLFANIIEWYEFSIYGYLSGVIGKLFFEETSAFLALINGFTLFATRFLARPIGSVFFGYFADSRGQRASLRLSLMLMAIPTCLIGLLPTYQTLGYWATATLLVLGLIQGFAAGGEFPVSACYVFENSPPQHRSLLCCAVILGNVMGFLSGATVAASLFSFFNHSTIEAWAWRIPFLLGIPLTFIIAKIRQAIPETRAKASTQSKSYFLWKKAKKQLMVGMSLAVFPAAIGAQLFSLWMPFYLNHFLAYPEAEVHYLNTLGIFSGACFSLLAAYLTRFIALPKLMKIGACGVCLLAYPLFAIINKQPSLGLVILILLIFKFFVSLIGGVVVEVLGKLFAQARATGMSIAYSLPIAIFGGTTPLICTYMTEKWGALFPAFYCMVFSLIALIAAIQFPRLVANDS
jgi:MFS transporter, MHS family, proline/betaine transporter